MKFLAAHQPNYLAYYGTLGKALASSVFVHLDTLQYTKNDWQNRNRIRTRDGWCWITIPARASLGQKITEVFPSNDRWFARHQRAIRSNYGDGSSLWREHYASLAAVKTASIAEIGMASTNFFLQRAPMAPTQIRFSELRCQRIRNETDRELRLIYLTKHLGCDGYLSGLGARQYLSPATWKREGVALYFFDPGELRYRQRFPDFVSHLSYLDLALNEVHAERMLLQSCSIAPMGAWQPVIRRREFLGAWPANSHAAETATRHNDFRPSETLRQNHCAAVHIGPPAPNSNA